MSSWLWLTTLSHLAIVLGPSDFMFTVILFLENNQADIICWSVILDLMAKSNKLQNHKTAENWFSHMAAEFLLL